jgi:maltodextrin utilization protein YvdJ
MTTITPIIQLFITNVTGYKVNNVEGTTQQTQMLITQNTCPISIPFNLDAGSSIPNPEIQINHDNGQISIAVNNGWIVDISLFRQNTFILNYETSLSVILVIDGQFYITSSNVPGDLGGGIAMVGTVSMIVQK